MPLTKRNCFAKLKVYIYILHGCTPFKQAVHTCMEEAFFGEQPTKGSIFYELCHESSAGQVCHETKMSKLTKLKCSAENGNSWDNPETQHCYSLLSGLY